MRALILLAGAAALCGCAAFERPADFPLERYAGRSAHEQLLAKVNVETNLMRPCAQLTRCQRSAPSRSELRAAAFLDGTGYAMAKAYALQDEGIDESRMRVARYYVLGRWHVALVVDERYVLDNFYSEVRSPHQYDRFHPLLAALPGTLMAEGRRPGDAAVGR